MKNNDKSEIRCQWQMLTYEKTKKEKKEKNKKGNMGKVK